jgi:hypothetical protein
MIDHFVKMGFPEKMVAEAIQENCKGSLLFQSEINMHDSIMCTPTCIHTSFHQRLLCNSG